VISDAWPADKPSVPKALASRSTVRVEMPFTYFNEYQAAGDYEIGWQPKGLPSGLYFYKIKAGDLSTTSHQLRSGQAGQRFSETKKLILLK